MSKKEAERFMEMIQEIEVNSGDNLAALVSPYLNVPIQNVRQYFGSNAQFEGMLGEYHFYLKHDEDCWMLHVARLVNDVHLSPDWVAFEADMSEGKQRDLAEIFVNLLSHLERSRKLYYFPAQPRWNESDEVFCDSGNKFMIGPWYPKGTYIGLDELPHFIVTGTVSSRGYTEDDALTNLFEFTESTYLSDQGWSIEKQREFHERKVEAVQVGLHSWPFPLEEVLPAPEEVPVFLKTA